MPGKAPGRGDDDRPEVMKTPSEEISQPPGRHSPTQLPLNEDGSLKDNAAYVKKDGDARGRLHPGGSGGPRMPQYSRTFRTDPDHLLTVAQRHALSDRGSVQAAQQYNADNRRAGGGPLYNQRGPQTTSVRYDRANNSVAVGTQPKCLGDGNPASNAPPAVQDHYRNYGGRPVDRARDDAHAEANTVTQLHAHAGRLPQGTETVATYRHDLRADASRHMAACADGGRNCRNAEDALGTHDLDEGRGDARDQRTARQRVDQTRQRHGDWLRDQEEARRSRIAGGRANIKDFFGARRQPPPGGDGGEGDPGTAAQRKRSLGRRSARARAWDGRSLEGRSRQTRRARGRRSLRGRLTPASCRM